MPVLVISHPVTGDREVELTDASLRLGRDPLNDIVLDELVWSRFHAEIYCDAAGYHIVDQESVNGLWVDGRRVAEVELRPGTIVNVGEYSLTVRGEFVPTARGEFGPSAEAPLPPPDDGHTVFDPPVSPRGVPTPRPAQFPPVPAAPVRRDHPAAVRRYQAALFAGAAVLVAGVLAVAYIRRPPTTKLVEPPPQGPAPSSTTSVPPTIETTSSSTTTTSVGDTASRPPRPRQPQPPPEIPRGRGETEAEWKARVVRVEARYNEAQEALATNPAAAIALLEQLLRDQRPYRDVDDLLRNAQEKLRTQSRAAVERARLAEEARNWTPALDAYQEAARLDASFDPAPHVARVRAAMAKEGLEAYGMARKLFAYRRNTDALPYVERAVALLPPGGAEHQEAVKMLQEIKSRP